MPRIAEATSNATMTSRSNARALIQSLQPILESGYYAQYQGVHFIAPSREAVDRVCREWNTGSNASGQQTNLQQTTATSNMPDSQGQQTTKKGRPKMSAEARAKLSAALKARHAAQKRSHHKATTAATS